MFTDNEARERIEMLEHELALLKDELRNQAYINLAPIFSVTVREAVIRLLEYMELEVVYRPGDIVISKKAMVKI